MTEKAETILILGETQPYKQPEKEFLNHFTAAAADNTLCPVKGEHLETEVDAVPLALALALFVGNAVDLPWEEEGLRRGLMQVTSLIRQRVALVAESCNYRRPTAVEHPRLVVCCAPAPVHIPPCSRSSEEEDQVLDKGLVGEEDD